jgi:hydrogenase maturation protein HypF
VRTEIEGIVQGVGFRPHLHRLATELDLAGWVLNTSSGVLLELEGPAACIDEFMLRARDEAPPLSRILVIRSIRLPSVGLSGFAIRPSIRHEDELTLLCPDVAVCGDCLRELFDPADRRYRYPFINCTNCGPRYSIVESLPYDRAATTMSEFEMCAECRAEFGDPRDRRYHAQPIACPRCGPRARYVSGEDSSERESALADTVALLLGGGIVAIKGIGGFHLACRADRDDVVLELRRRKRRSFFKPLAVMVRESQLEELFVVSRESLALMQSPPSPIVLLPLRPEPDCCRLSEYVAPNLDRIGVMLPYSPLHHILLADCAVPLVMSSANLSDEPIIADNELALDRLRDICDGFLLHDRQIHARCDDSVIAPGEVEPPAMLRHSRGYSPFPLALQDDGPDILAFGGDLKTTFAASRGRFVFLSPHLGDGEHLETYSLFRATWDNYRSLFGLRPEAIACDLHPGYHTGRWAAELAQQYGIPLVRVQHHHAHMAALLAEYNLQGEQTAIIADGTGYGEDGTMWGGEVLRGSAAHCERLAHLRHIPLAGGDAAVKQPWRIALGLLHAAFPGAIPEYVARLIGKLTAPELHKQGSNEETAATSATVLPDTTEVKAVIRMLDSGTNVVQTSALGRLFDGVAALLGICPVASYEGQAPMELEAVARLHGPEGLVPPSLPDGGQRGTIDWSGIVRECLKQSTVSKSARLFHAWAARQFLHAALAATAPNQPEQLLGSGGCFQNSLFCAELHRLCDKRGIALVRHSLIPPGDGGLALGSLLIARDRLRS